MRLVERSPPCLLPPRPSANVHVASSATTGYGRRAMSTCAYRSSDMSISSAWLGKMNLMLSQSSSMTVSYKESRLGDPLFPSAERRAIARPRELCSSMASSIPSVQARRPSSGAPLHWPSMQLKFPAATARIRVPLASLFGTSHVECSSGTWKHVLLHRTDSIDSRPWVSALWIMHQQHLRWASAAPRSPVSHTRQLVRWTDQSHSLTAEG